MTRAKRHGSDSHTIESGADGLHSGGGQLKRARLAASEPPRAVWTARELKNGDISVAESLLADGRRMFPQKQTFVLHWLVDVLIRANKSKGTAVRSVQHWRLLATLAPLLPATVTVHPGLAFALATALDPGGSGDGSNVGELLRHAAAVVKGLQDNFHPRIDGLNAIVVSLSSLVSSTQPEHVRERTVALQVAATALQMFSTAMLLSSNMKRNFTMATTMLPDLVLLRAAAIGAGRESRAVTEALEELLTRSMFHRDQLSDYHLAFSPFSPTKAAASADCTNSKPSAATLGARGVVSYQAQLFVRLRKLLAHAGKDAVMTQRAALESMPWIFNCFVKAVSRHLDVEARAGEQHGYQRNAEKGSKSSGSSGGARGQLSAKVCFDFFVECHKIIQPLLCSDQSQLRLLAVRGSLGLLVKMLDSGVYRKVLDQNFEQSRESIHAPVKDIAQTLLDACVRSHGILPWPSMDVAVWDASREFVSCVNTLLDLDHRSVEHGLASWWICLGTMRARASESTEIGNVKKSLSQLSRACVDHIRQVFATYQRLFRVPVVMASLFEAIRNQRVRRDTVAALDICGVFAALVPSLPPGQVPGLCAGFRAELIHYCEVATPGGDPDINEVCSEALDVVTALLIALVQHSVVDESSSQLVEAEIHALKSEVLEPYLFTPNNGDSNVARTATGTQALVHLQRAIASLSCRLSCDNALASSSSIAIHELTKQLEQYRVREKISGISVHTHNHEQVDLATTYAALQQLAVLHDSTTQTGTASNPQYFAQMQACVSLVWGEMSDYAHLHNCSQNTTEGTAQLTKPPTAPRDILLVVKWQWIIHNIFLLSMYTPKLVLSEFYTVLLRLFAGHHVTKAGIICRDAARELVTDRRFFELHDLRNQVFPVAAGLALDLCNEVCDCVCATRELRDLLDRMSKISENVWVAEEDDAELLSQLHSSTGIKLKSSGNDQMQIQSVFRALSKLFDFLRSMPVGLLPDSSRVSCLRLALFLLHLVSVVTRVTTAMGARLNRVLADAHAFLGWAIQTTVSGSQMPDTTQIVVVAWQRFLAAPLQITETAMLADDPCALAVRSCMKNVAEDQAATIRNSESPLNNVLRNVVEFSPGDSTTARQWKMIYLTEFLEALNSAVVGKDSRSNAVLWRAPGEVDHSEAALQLPGSLTICAAELKAAARLVSPPGQRLRCGNERDCDFACIVMNAATALLDAHRIECVAKSRRTLLNTLLTAPVATCASFLLPHGDTSSQPVISASVQVSSLALLGAISRLLGRLESPMPLCDYGVLISILFRSHASSVCERVKECALDAIRSLVCGSATEQLDLLLHTIESEMDTSAIDLDFSFPRVWTAMEAMRAVEAIIRTSARHHAEALRRASTIITKGLLDILAMSLGQLQRRFDTGLSFLTGHAISLAALQMISGLVHYPAVIGRTHTAQAACTIQSVHRVLVASSPKYGDWLVSLHAMDISMEVLTALIKLRPKDVLSAMPLFSTCIGKLLNSVWDAAAARETYAAAGKAVWERCGTKLGGIYELLARHLAVAAMRRYVSYLLSDYIHAALRHGVKQHPVQQQLIDPVLPEDGGLACSLRPYLRVLCAHLSS